MRKSKKKVARKDSEEDGDTYDLDDVKLSEF